MLQIYRNYRKSKTQRRDSMACMAEIMGRIFDQSKCRNFHAFRSLCWPFSYDSFGISVNVVSKLENCFIKIFRHISLRNFRFGLIPVKSLTKSERRAQYLFFTKEITWDRKNSGMTLAVTRQRFVTKTFLLRSLLSFG